MSYTSFKFLVFVFITAIAYFLFPSKKYQWTVLLAASYIFYLFAGYKYAAFLLITTVTTYLSALWIDKITQKSKAELKVHKADWDKDQKKEYKNRIKGQKKAIMVVMVVLNLGILAFLKYYNFLAGGLNDLLQVGGLDFRAPAMKLFLPLGISFYTFQSIGYVVDVSREEVAAERNIAKVALFVSTLKNVFLQGVFGKLARKKHTALHSRQRLSSFYPRTNVP